MPKMPDSVFERVIRMVQFLGDLLLCVHNNPGKGITLDEIEGCNIAMAVYLRRRDTIHWILRMADCSYVYVVSNSKSRESAAGLEVYRMLAGGAVWTFAGALNLCDTGVRAIFIDMMTVGERVRVF